MELHVKMYVFGFRTCFYQTRYFTRISASNTASDDVE